MDPLTLASRWCGFARFEESQADRATSEADRLYNLGSAHAHKSAAFQLVQELLDYNYEQASQFVHDHTTTTESVSA